tara:strand:- start:853 stop:1635 length:783 start_codon:yes stop_codon:yes gene_type:complete
MQLKDNQMRFMNVEVLWPRLDMPYKQNSATGQWDKCQSILDEDGKYEVIIKLQPEQAEELAAKMSAMFKADFPGKHWLIKVRDPETGGDSDLPVKKWQDLFKETDDGRFQRKLQIKTYKTPTTKPQIYDNHFEEIGIKDREPDFEMTTGSMVHCVVDLKTWTYGGKHGVSTRPEAFAVLTRAERKPPSDPAQKVNHFGDLAQPKEKSEGEMIFGDQAVPTTPEPMGRATIEAASPFPQAEKKEDIKVHPSLNGDIDEIPF